MTNAKRDDHDTGYLCCGFSEQANEISEMIGNAQRKVVASGQATWQAISNGKPGEQVQDWSNPFAHMREQRHSYEESSRFAHPPEDDRSAVTQPPRKSADIRDMEEYHNNDGYPDPNRLGVRQARVREIRAANKVNYSNNRALRLQEQIIMNSEKSYDSSYEQRRPKPKHNNRQFENKKLIDKHLMINRQMSERAMARRDAAMRSKALRQQALLVKNTESTRVKNHVTPDDVRDPETVAGMKCQVDIELEEAAKKQAVAMLCDEQYKFNHKAGIAAFSAREIAFNHRKSTTLLGPLV